MQWATFCVSVNQICKSFKHNQNTHFNKDTNKYTSNCSHNSLPNIYYSDVYVYFVDKVKKPFRNEYGYVSGYDIDLYDESNAVKEIRFKIKVKDKAYGKESSIVESIISDLSSLGYMEVMDDNDNGAVFDDDLGWKVAEVWSNRNYIYLNLFFYNDPEVDYSNP